MAWLVLDTATQLNHSTSPRDSAFFSSLRAAAGSFVFNTTVPLTFTPSFDLSGGPRAAARPSVASNAGRRTRRSPIARVAGSLRAAVDSVVSNITASTYLHPVTLHL